MRSKPTYVLGTGLSHDGSACLIKNGRIAVAIAKERITRVKHDGFNDSAAIKYCLEAEGISGRDLTLVVQNANFSMFKRGNSYFHGERILPDGVPIVSISHHLAHAYSAVATAPFEEMAVLVVDGCGNSLEDCSEVQPKVLEKPGAGSEHLYFEKDSYYVFADGKLRHVVKDFSPWGRGITGDPMIPPTTLHSIGGVYSAVSRYIFRNLDDAGKVMGLAPYGRRVIEKPMFDLADGRVFVRYDWMSGYNRPARSYEDFRRDFQYYADIASWCQREIERALLYLFKSRFEMRAMKNIAYAGGVALNAVANGRLSGEGPFKEMYVQPAAGDDGLSLGCATYGWLEVLGRKRVPHNGAASFGRLYSKSEAFDALRKYSSHLRFRATPEFIICAADLLSAGKVIGWFQGGSEFGPRALGNRSILASPSSKETGDRINRDIKFREDFRPFAPAVPVEFAKNYFDFSGDAPYMTRTVSVRQEFRTALGAVVHQDGSARLQTVTRASNPKFWDLLRAFGDRTQLPVLLNTSLNRRGMPIVESPLECIEFFLECDLDGLILDNYVVEKR